MYLVIVNNGEVDIHGLTLMGLSTARGNKDMIGQFGTGAKYAVLTCLRHGIEPTLYIGTKKLRFFTETGNMQGKEFKRLCHEYDGVVEKSSLTLECGSLDWTELDMGLREFVSNALDAAGGNPYEVSVTMTENPMPVEGKTTVVIPMTPQVNKFYSELNDRFLHFRPDYDPNKFIIPNEVEEAVGKVYRRGVFVRETKLPSLYHYNLGDDVKIDECRNMSDDTVTTAIAKLWRGASEVTLCGLFSQLAVLSDKTTEHNLHYYYLKPDTQTRREVWKSAFNLTFGDKLIGRKEDAQIILAAVKKGRYSVQIESFAWYTALQCAGIECVSEFMKQRGEADREGRKLKPATQKLFTNLRKVWGKLEDKGLTQGRPCPDCKIFIDNQEGGAMTLGYYENGVVYIEEEQTGNKHAILHELAHHITQADDNSSDMQEFFCKTAVVFMR